MKLGTNIQSTSHVGSKIAIKMGGGGHSRIKAFSGNNHAKPVFSIFPLQIDISCIS